MCQRRLSVALVTDAHTQEINNNEVQKRRKFGTTEYQERAGSWDVIHCETDDLQDDEESVTKT